MAVDRQDDELFMETGPGSRLCVSHLDLQAGERGSSTWIRPPQACPCPGSAQRPHPGESPQDHWRQGLTCRLPPPSSASVR